MAVYEQNIDDNLRYILESDSTKVEELMKKYSDELSTMICHMEQKLEELLVIVMSSCRPMTHSEKQQLRKLIQSLPPGNLDRVAEIIRQHNPSKNTFSDEIRVDLDDEVDTRIWLFIDGFYLSLCKANSEVGGNFVGHSNIMEIVLLCNSR